MPSPLTFFDMLIHVAPMILMRGTPEAVEYYQLLKAEIEERVANQVAAVPGERFRFYWEGPPDLVRAAAAGRAVPATTRLPSWPRPTAASSRSTGMDAKNPVESMARTYTGIFHNRSDDYKEEYLLSKFRDYGVDGVVYHEGRTSPEHSNVRYGLEMRLRRLTGLQAIVLEADTHDLRLFSADRIERKLLDFIEMRTAAPLGDNGRDPGPDASPDAGPAADRTNPLQNGRAHG